MPVLSNGIEADCLFVDMNVSLAPVQYLRQEVRSLLLLSAKLYVALKK